MQIIKIINTGKREEKNILRKDLAIKLGVHIRDLRPVFLFRQVPTVFTRGKNIIVNLGIVKMVITTKQAFICNTANSEVVDHFVPELLEEIKSWKAESKIRFEFWILEFLLTYEIRSIRKNFFEVEREGSALLQALGQDYDDRNLERLLNFKKKLLRFGIGIKEGRTAVLDILEDDEEMESLYFSDETNTEEMESILESFVEQTEEIVNDIQELSENLDDTQEIIALKMDNRRNTIIRLDLVGTIATALLTILTVITGIYGMNVRNNWEENFHAFLWLVGGMWSLFFVGIIMAIFILRRRKIL